MSMLDRGEGSWSSEAISELTAAYKAQTVESYDERVAMLAEAGEKERQRYVNLLDLPMYVVRAIKHADIATLDRWIARSDKDGYLRAMFQIAVRVDGTPIVKQRYLEES